VSLHLILFFELESCLSTHDEKSKKRTEFATRDFTIENKR
jgi:hypothetical protein